MKKTRFVIMALTLCFLLTGFTCSNLTWDQICALMDESDAAGCGGACAIDHGKLVYNPDGTGALAPEVSYADESKYLDSYYVKDDSGNLITIRQFYTQNGYSQSGFKYTGGSSGSSTNKCEHEYTSEVTKEPTCVDPGTTTYACSKCGNTYTEDIDATGIHDYEVTVDKEPTCTETGLNTMTCKICGYTEEQVVPAIGHDYKDTVTKEPTCTEKGEKTYTCTNCNDTYTEDIPATGHTLGEWEVTKDAGLFTEGEKVRKCLSCDEILETAAIESTLPIWYLYAGIGAVVLIAAIAAGIVLIVKKKKNTI